MRQLVTWRLFPSLYFGTPDDGGGGGDGGDGGGDGGGGDGGGDGGGGDSSGDSSGGDTSSTDSSGDGGGDFSAGSEGLDTGGSSADQFGLSTDQGGDFNPSGGWSGDASDVSFDFGNLPTPTDFGGVDFSLPSLSGIGPGIAFGDGSGDVQPSATDQQAFDLGAGWDVASFSPIDLQIGGPTDIGMTDTGGLVPIDGMPQIDWQSWIESLSTNGLTIPAPDIQTLISTQTQTQGRIQTAVEIPPLPMPFPAPDITAIIQQILSGGGQTPTGTPPGPQQPPQQEPGDTVPPLPTPAPLPSPVPFPTTIPSPLPVVSASPTVVQIPGQRAGTTVIAQPVPAPMPIIVNVVQPAEVTPAPGPQQIELVGQPLQVALPGLERLTTELLTLQRAFMVGILSIAERIQQDIHQEIAVLEPTIIDQAAKLNALISGGVLAFEEAFPNAQSIAEGFANVLTEHWPDWQPQLDTLLSTAAADGMLNALTGLAAGGAPKVAGILDAMPGGACVAAAVKGLLVPLGAEALLTDGLALIMGAIDILKVFVDAAMSGPAALVEQDSMLCARPTLISIGEVQEGLRRGLVGDDTATDQLGRHGYKDELIALLKALSQRLLDRDDVLDAQLRGMFDPAIGDERLAALGYSSTDVDVIKQLRQLLPTPTDLVRFMLRDLWPAPFATATIDDHGKATFTESSESVNFVEEFGMDLEFPEGALEWFDKLGIPREWAHRHWQAHWELPSPEQAFQMLFRAGLPQEALTRLLRARGIEPYWREFYQHIAYHPITRVDIRRIAKLLDKDRDWLIDRYKQLGYIQANAELQADFTIEYNKGQTTATKLNQVSGLAGHIKTAYLNGSLTEEQARQHLLKLGFPDADVEQFIVEGELERVLAFHNQIRAAVHKLYVAQFWTKEQATAELLDKGFTTPECDRLFESWDLDLDYKELTQEEKAHRELTKAEALAAYDEGFIDLGQLNEYLAKLHYTVDEQAVIIQVAALKKQRAAQKDQETAIEAEFMAGELLRAEASNALDAIHVEPAKREALLARWSLAARKQTAKLTNTEVKDLYSKGTMNEAQVLDELERQGYSVTDAARLLILWGSTDAELLKTATEARNRAAAVHRLSSGVRNQTQ